MRWRVCLPLLAACIFGMPACAQEPKLAVVVARVQAPNPVANQALEEWLQASQLHLQTIGSEALHQAYPGRAISVVALSRQQVPDLKELKALWDAREAIYVIGSTAVISGQVTRIDSLVYMGAFRGRLSTEMFPLRQSVRGSDYDASRRMLEALTLYGLGNQALRQGRRSVACALFRRGTIALTGQEMQTPQAASLRSAIILSRGDQKC